MHALVSADRQTLPYHPGGGHVQVAVDEVADAEVAADAAGEAQMLREESDAQPAHGGGMGPTHVWAE